MNGNVVKYDVINYTSMTPRLLTEVEKYDMNSQVKYDVMNGGS